MKKIIFVVKNPPEKKPAGKKNILEAPFLAEMKKTIANMYRLGWDERNGGNVSYLLTEEEVGEYLDLGHVIRTIPFMGVKDTAFDASPLAGKYFLVTGTGKYFKNVEDDPETNLGIVRIAQGGKEAELLWGFKDGGRPTSEFPAHMSLGRSREPRRHALPSYPHARHELRP